MYSDGFIYGPEGEGLIADPHMDFKDIDEREASTEQMNSRTTRDTVMSHTIWRNRQQQSFVIYTQREADNLGFDYVPWREAQSGQWALTDDVYVAECLSRNTYTDSRGNTRDIVVLSFGRAWVPRNKDFCFEPFLQSGHYGGTTPKSWIEREARTQRARRTVQVYCAMILSPNGIDWMVLAHTYRPNQPVKTVRRLLKQERIRRMVTDELRRILTGEGITEQEVLRMYLKAFSTAEQTDNPSAMRQVARDLAAMLDMQPNKGQQSTSQRRQLEDVVEDTEFDDVEFLPVIPGLLSPPTES